MSVENSVNNRRYYDAMPTTSFLQIGKNSNRRVFHVIRAMLRYAAKKRRKDGVNNVNEIINRRHLLDPRNHR